MKTSYIVNIVVLMYTINFLLSYDYIHKYSNISNEKKTCFNFYSTQNQDKTIERLCQKFKYDYIEFSLATSKQLYIYSFNNIVFAYFVTILQVLM